MQSTPQHLIKVRCEESHQLENLKKEELLRSKKNRAEVEEN